KSYGQSRSLISFRSIVEISRQASIKKKDGIHHMKERIKSTGEGILKKQVKLGSRNRSNPRPSIFSLLRSLVVAEVGLVYGVALGTTRQLTESPASQLMCQGSEIVSPPSGPNLSFLPQIDKWLLVALQDADSYYWQKKYGIAASRFTTALEVLRCCKFTILGKSVSADYEDVSEVADFTESTFVACYLSMLSDTVSAFLSLSLGVPKLIRLYWQVRMDGQSPKERLIVQSKAPGQLLDRVGVHGAAALHRLPGPAAQSWWEQSQVMHQAPAELTLAPCLQDISQPHAELQALMTDVMDTLERRQDDKERVWNEIQKVNNEGKNNRDCCPLHS
uniref:Uncharacterized protein n=1 Tax=Scleropages formosus TaxID=113540 RepID=A0A8D0CNC5_SCLFO